MAISSGKLILTISKCRFQHVPRGIGPAFLDNPINYFLPHPLRTGNDFTGSDEFEFDDAKDIEWSGNKMDGGACAKGDLDFTSGSDKFDSC